MLSLLTSAGSLASVLGHSRLCLCTYQSESQSSYRFASHLAGLADVFGQFFASLVLRGGQFGNCAFYEQHRFLFLCHILFRFDVA